MRRRRPAGRIAIGVAVLALAACGLGKNQGHPDDPVPSESAERLRLSDNEGAIYALLDPEEREAAERAGIRGADETPDDRKESSSDTAAQAGISILSVALVVGAAVAPFFLF